MPLSDKEKTELINSTTIHDDTEQEQAKPEILIVDDDPFARELIRRVLSKENYNVTLAEGVNKALGILEDKSFSLILSDIVMPDGSGMDLLNEIKFKSPETEIILLTGTPDLSQAVKAMKEGALDYITKPYMPDKLLETVKSGLLKVKNNRAGRDRIKLPGKYELVGFLGEGSMGLVYLVRHEGEDFALKVLKSYPSDPNTAIHMKRFFREEKIMSKIKHPNIVRIFDSGITEDKMPFIVMECLKGKTLECYIGTQDISLGKKLNMIADIAEALSVLHAEDIVHRDIKPENIFVLDDSMQIKLTDFGISYMKNATLTKPDVLCGSPGYISPEYLKNQGFSTVSDIFSLGVVAYQFLSGMHPFPGESLEQIIHSIMNREPVDLSHILPEIPQKISNIIMKMLKQEPKARPQNAAKVAKEIRKNINSRSSGWF